MAADYLHLGCRSLTQKFSEGRKASAEICLRLLRIMTFTRNCQCPRYPQELWNQIRGFGAWLYVAAGLAFVRFQLLPSPKPFIMQYRGLILTNTVLGLLIIIIVQYTPNFYSNY